MSTVAGAKVSNSTGWADARRLDAALSPIDHQLVPRAIVRWSISRAALAASPAAAGRAIALTRGNSGPDPVLEWTVVPGRAVAKIVDGPLSWVVFELSPAGTPSDRDHISITTIDQLIHLSVDRAGSCVLSATLRRGTVRPVLYARTALIAEIGIAGGRYEILDGGVLDPHAPATG